MGKVDHLALDTQRAWIDGARVIAYRTAAQLDVARHDADPKRRERAQRWCALVTPVLKAACTQQKYRNRLGWIFNT